MSTLLAIAAIMITVNQPSFTITRSDGATMTCGPGRQITWAWAKPRFLGTIEGKEVFINGSTAMGERVGQQHWKRRVREFLEAAQ